MINGDLPVTPALAICYDYSTPFEQCVDCAHRAGFEIVSLGMRVGYSGYDTAEGRGNAARVLRERGMTLDNVHDGNGMLATLDQDAHRKAIDDAVMSIEAAAELDAGKTVHHLSGAGSAPEALSDEIDCAKRAVEALLVRARQLNVTLAFENSWREPYMAVLRAVLAEFDDPLVGFCYDTSHDQLYDKGEMKALQRFGDRLAVLHVSDNLGEKDDHQPPWEGVIDWERFTSLLSAMPYEGPMLLECQVSNSEFKDLAMFTHETYARARQLIDMACPDRGE